MGIEMEQYATELRFSILKTSVGQSGTLIPVDLWIRRQMINRLRV